MCVCRRTLALQGGLVEERFGADVTRRCVAERDGDERVRVFEHRRLRSAFTQLHAHTHTRAPVQPTPSTVAAIIVYSSYGHGRRLVFRFGG